MLNDDFFKANAPHQRMLDEIGRSESILNRATLGVQRSSPVSEMFQKLAYPPGWSGPSEQIRHAFEPSIRIMRPCDSITDAALGALGRARPWVEGSHLRNADRMGSERTSEMIALQKKLRDLERELSTLHDEVDAKEAALNEQATGAADRERVILELKTSNAKLANRQELFHLVSRLEPKAQQKIFESKAFLERFSSNELCEAFVISIDLRRSTELMLKARTPKLFAEFIVGLTRLLRNAVLINHGIFDKFTGDGVLAFFPSFYSGSDAGMFALRAAAHAHQAFAEHYDSYRHCFTTVLRDVGLGIGLDFGQVQIVHLDSELTVVGTPVVYACRMGAAAPGQTLVNQPAYEQLEKRYSVPCDFVPVDLDIKGEGRTLAYAVRLNGRDWNIADPEWLSETEPDTAEAVENA